MEKKSKSKGNLNQTNFSLGKKSLPSNSDTVSSFSIRKKGLMKGGSGVNQPKGYES